MVRILLFILMLLIFGFSMAMVMANTSNIQVDLLFAQVPAMNLGLLLVITLGLGIIVGLLLGVFVFRVVQNRWEISRLNKELELVRSRHIQAAAAAAAASAAASTPIKHDDNRVVPPAV